MTTIIPEPSRSKQNDPGSFVEMAGPDHQIVSSLA